MGEDDSNVFSFATTIDKVTSPREANGGVKHSISFSDIQEIGVSIVLLKAQNNSGIFGNFKPDMVKHVPPFIEPNAGINVVIITSGR